MNINEVYLPLENVQHQRDGSFETLKSREERHENAFLPRPLKARLKWQARIRRFDRRQRQQSYFQLRQQEHSIGKNGDELVIVMSAARLTGIEERFLVRASMAMRIVRV